MTLNQHKHLKEMYKDFKASKFMSPSSVKYQISKYYLYYNNYIETNTVKPIKIIQLAP